MLGILRQKVGAGSSSAMLLGQRIRPATSAMWGFASSAKETNFPTTVSLPSPAKLGKLKNWLAVCDVDNTLSAGLGLGLLLPQLSDEPWKGKVVAYSKNPRLHSIQGDDLNSRAKYMQTLIKSQDWTADFGKVFNVILEEAVNADLKPDKMVKKVLALTTYKHFLTGSNFSFWGGDYLRGNTAQG